MSQAQEDFDFDPSLWPKGVNLFPWMPLAPRVPEKHPYQRWFETDIGGRWVADLFSVFRDGNEDAAELSLTVGRGAVRAQVAGVLTAEECRRLAALLLCAAADIEAHPSESLKPLIAEQEKRVAAKPVETAVETVVEKVVVPWD